MRIFINGMECPCLEEISITVCKEIHTYANILYHSTVAALALI
jgi:hypothetical protein